MPQFPSKGCKFISVLTEKTLVNMVSKHLPSLMSCLGRSEPAAFLPWPPRLTASLLHLSLVISGLCLSCAASLRSLPLSPARIVFSELNGNEHGEDGFCKWTLQNCVTYPLFGDALVCVTRARGGGYQRSQVFGRNTERVKLTFTEVGTLKNRYAWE